MTTHDRSMEWPNIEHYSDTPVFNTKAAVQRTGVPAPTLRAWERRYTLLSPERADNTYRLYSERDIGLIRWLKERVDNGMSISQSVALYRHLSQEHLQRNEQFLDEPGTLPSTSAALFELTNETVPPLETHTPANNREAREHILDWTADGGEHAYENYALSENRHSVCDRLIEVFQNLDEQTAHILMGSMFSLYPLELVCLEIIVPTMWQIGQLWAKGELTVSVEHFASNFFRALLTNRFYVTPGRLDGPLIIAGCAPREVHELAALMLALFLRRSGLHVAYLGQGVETTGLIHTIKKLNPVAVCLSSTMPYFIKDLINLGKHIQNLSTPRPTLVFGGQAFLQHAKFIPEVPGIYMEGGLKEITDKIHTLIQNAIENRN